MNLTMYSVHDEKAQAFLTPFFMLHDGQAIRTFEDCINSRDHQFSHHPSDYTLFKIGTFNDQGAALTDTTPISLGNGVEFKNSAQREYLEGLKPDAKQISDDDPGTLRASTQS